MCNQALVWKSKQQRHHYPLASCIYQITWSLPCPHATKYSCGRLVDQHPGTIVRNFTGFPCPCEASVQAEEQNTSVFLRILECYSSWTSLDMFFALSCWVLSLERHRSAVGHTGRTMSPKLRYVCQGTLWWTYRMLKNVTRFPKLWKPGKIWISDKPQRVSSNNYVQIQSWECRIKQKVKH